MQHFNPMNHIEICMIKLGITGQIASGKTTAAQEFALLGGHYISADSIGREVVERNAPVLSKLIRAFGTEIVTPEGMLKRRVLGRKVFTSHENMQILNKIVHPPLLKRLDEEIEECKNDPACKIIVVDAALLIDWNYHKKMDYTVCVVCEKSAQISRLTEKGFSETEIEERIKSQKAVSDLRAASDFVIDNNGTIEELKNKVKYIFEHIKNISQSGEK